LTDKIRYTRAADGTRLAYRTTGEEGPALVFTNGFATSSFYWKYLVQRFDGRARMVTWDFKGHGHSAPARSREAVDVPSMVDDLVRVMDAASIEHATLLGFSLGCQIIFEAWHRHPDRIDALVPILGTYGRPFDNLFHPLAGRALYQIYRSLADHLSGPALKMLSLSAQIPEALSLSQAIGLIGNEVLWRDIVDFFSHLGDLDATTIAAMGTAIQEHDASGYLAEIDVPTLVIAGGRDALTPGEIGREMHEKIEGSQLLFLRYATHAGLFEYPELIGATVDYFLRDHGLVHGVI
jgi:pimeloyl-ACP methyl ester carboxylesterase